MRPKTNVERAMDGEIEWDKLPCAPHCDARVLHLPSECVYCAAATELQEERERLEISNTGHTNRKWPCPGDRERGLKSLNSWHGNRAQTKEQLEETFKTWREQLKVLTED